VYRNQLHYLIRMMLYDSLTWERAKFVNVLQAVEEFHQRFQEKPGPFEDVLRGHQA